MLIPSGIFNIYYQAVDELINNNFVGKSCTVYYPPITSNCANCTTSYFGGTSKNVYKHGGPAPFTLGNCPLCGGNGVKQVQNTDTLRLRVYWERRDWIKQGSYNIPDADVMVIGFTSDISKIIQMEEIELINEQSFVNGRYVLSGEPFTHGFGHNRYFVAYLKRG